MQVTPLNRYGLTESGTYYHFDVTDEHIYITATTATAMTVQRVNRPKNLRD